MLGLTLDLNPSGVALAIRNVLYGGVNRNFTELSAAAQKHDTIPEVTATGDFELEFDFYVPSLTEEFALGYSANPAVTINTAPNGAIRYRSLSGHSRLTATGLYAANTLNRCRIKKVSGVVEIFVNGVPALSVSDSGSITFDRIGTYGGGLYYDGIISNVNFISGFTQTGNPAGNPRYPLDENWINSTVVRNANATLGSELYSFSGFTGWNEARDSSTLSLNGERIVTTADGTGTYGASYGLSGLTVGETYLVSFNVDRISDQGGTIFLRRDSVPSLNDNTGGESFATGNGTFNKIITATSTSMYFGFVMAGHGVGSSCEIYNLSIKQAPGYGTAVNITSADAELFNRVSDGWTGTNVISNGDFSDGSTGWSLQPGWSIANGIASYSGQGLLNSRDIYQAGTIVSGRTYRVTGNVLNYVSGELKLWTGLSDVFASSEEGPFSLDFTAASNRLTMFGAVEVTSDFSMDNIQAKRFLEVA